MIDWAIEANRKFRIRVDMMVNSGEALRGFPERLELVQQLTADESNFLRGSGWSPESAMQSDYIKQENILCDRVLSSDAQCVVLCVWDGVNLRQALMAKELFGVSEQSAISNTNIEPAIVEPPAMTAWGHFRLLHGAPTWKGLTKVVGRKLPATRHSALLSWAVQEGAIMEHDETYSADDVDLARDAIVQRQTEIFSPWAGAHFAYTGVRSVPPIQDNVIQPMLKAAELAGLEVTQTGSQGEMGQFGRIRKAFIDAGEHKAERMLVICRFSLDSKGKSAAMGADDHSALSSSGHYAGPFHRHAIQELNRIVSEFSPYSTTQIIASSDHGMTPLAQAANDPLKKRVIPFEAVIPQTVGTTPWFSGRGMLCRTEHLADVELGIKAVNGGEGWCPETLPCHDPDYTFVSLDHGWGIHALKGDNFGVSAHLGDHGGLGFDDMVVPLMTRTVTKKDGGFIFIVDPPYMT
jgi:hypothetical protein